MSVAVASTAPYWLAFGDIHDDLSLLETLPELREASGVLVTGDLTLAGGAKQALRVLEPLVAAVPRLLAQAGNMDRREVADLLEQKGWNLHAKAAELFPGVYVMGVGYSPPTPFNTPGEYPEERLAEWLQAAYAEARKLAAVACAATPVFVLAAHAPPYATACDRLRSGLPVGSTAVREFIEQHQPDLCLCGHIHEARAEDSIGNTRIINPGDLASGGYVLLRRTGESGSFGLDAELKVRA
ncbi:MAG: metallophosphoesterase [Desulfovibrionaceae bacterium]|nr:metallophosphoesterase [Desulfovibrionaceae bacterium]